MICSILLNLNRKFIYPRDICGNQMKRELLISLLLSSLILIIPASLMAWERTEITLSEPAIMLLLGSGLLGMGILVRRKFKRGLWLIRGYRVTKSPSTKRWPGFLLKLAREWKSTLLKRIYGLKCNALLPFRPILQPDGSLSGSR